MSKRAEVLFLNDRFLPVRDARVSPLDRGLLYGDGLFETIRSYPEGPFALEQHLERLRAGGRSIRLPIPRALRWWREAIRELLARNGLRGRDGVVRITVTRGVGGGGLVLPRKPSPTILIVARALAPDLEKRRREGVNVTLLGFRQGSGGLLEGLKTVHYLTAAIGKTLAVERGAFEGLYQTKRGEILEGTTSNVFVVRRGRLETPALSQGVLPGTTRDRVLSLARSAGVTSRERRLSVRGLLEAEEAFLTASTIEIVPIVAVDGRRIGDREGPVTKLLQRLYTQYREVRSKRSQK